MTTAGTPHEALKRQYDTLNAAADIIMDAIHDVRTAIERPADWGDVGKTARISDYARGFVEAVTEV